MEITRSTDTTQGLADWFSGTVFVDAAAAPMNGSRINASSVHFTPGARTAWHAHPHGQSLWVIEGIGVVQRRGAPAEVIRAGDRVFAEPGEEHWHGASPTRLMTHLSMVEVDEQGNAAAWGDHVTEEEYAAAAESALA